MEEKRKNIISKILRSKVLLVILLIVAICLAVSVVISDNLKKDIDKEIDSIKQKNEIYSISQTIPPLVDKKNNSAPLYNAAWDLTSFEDIQFQLDYTFDSYLKNKKYVDETIEENRAVFDLLKLADKKPDFRLDLEYHEGWNIKVPNYLKMRSMIEMIAYKSLKDTNDGNIDEAIDEIKSGLKFCRHLEPKENGGPMIQAMICCAMENTLIKAGSNIADRKIKADYSPLISEIDELIKVHEKSLYFSMQTERVYGMELFDELRNSLNPLKTLIEIFGTTDEDLKKLSGNILYMAHFKIEPLILNDELYYIRYMNKSVENIKNGKVQSDDFDRIPKRYLISKYITMNISRAFMNHAKTTKDLISLRYKLSVISINK